MPMEPVSAPQPLQRLHPGQYPYRAPPGAIYVQHIHHQGPCALNTLTGTRRSIEMVFHGFQAIASAYTIYYILYTIHFQTSQGYFSGSAWFLFFSSALSFLGAVCYGFLAWWTRTAAVKEGAIAAMRDRLQRRVDMEPLEKEADALQPTRDKKIRFAAFMLSRRPRAWILLGLVALTAMGAFVQGYRIRNGTDCDLYEEPLRRFCESTLAAVGALFIASVLWMLWLAFWFIVSSSSIRRAKCDSRGLSSDSRYLGERARMDARSRSFPMSVAAGTAGSLHTGGSCNFMTDTGSQPFESYRRAGSEQERDNAGVSGGEGGDSNNSTVYSSLRSQRHVQIAMSEEPQRGSSILPRDQKPELGDSAPFHSIELDDDSGEACGAAEPDISDTTTSSRRSRSVDLQGGAVKAPEVVSSHSNTLPRTRHSVLFSGLPLPSPENQLQGQRAFERLMHEHLQAIGAIRPESVVDDVAVVARSIDSDGPVDSGPSKVSLESVFSPTVPAEEAAKRSSNGAASLRLSMSSPNLRELQKATASSIKAMLGPFVPSSMSASRGSSGGQRSRSVYSHLHPVRSNTLPIFEASSEDLVPRPCSVSIGPGSSSPRSLARAGHFSMPDVNADRGARPTSTSSEYSLLSPHDQHRLQKFWDGKLPYPPPPSPTTARTRTCSSQLPQTPGSPPFSLSLFPDLNHVEKEKILKRTSQVFSLQQPQIRQLVRQKSQVHLPAIPLKEGQEEE